MNSPTEQGSGRRLVNAADELRDAIARHLVTYPGPAAVGPAFHELDAALAGFTRAAEGYLADRPAAAGGGGPCPS